LGHQVLQPDLSLILQMRKTYTFKNHEKNTGTFSQNENNFVNK